MDDPWDGCRCHKDEICGNEVVWRNDESAPDMILWINPGEEYVTLNAFLGNNDRMLTSKYSTKLSTWLPVPTCHALWLWMKVAPQQL